MSLNNIINYICRRNHIKYLALETLQVSPFQEIDSISLLTLSIPI